MGVSEQERELLKDSLRGLLETSWPAERAPDLLREPDAMRKVWKVLAEQGLAALGSGSEEGGLREVLMAQEELGRASCPAPLFGSALANLALKPYGGANAALADLLSAVHAGAAVPSFALTSGEPGEGRVEFAGGRLNGKAAFVEGAAVATHILVSVPQGLALVAAGGGVKVTPTPGYSVPPLGELVFEDAAATLIEVPETVKDDLVQLARMLLAARALGATQRGYEMVVEHVKTRRQFGVPLGTFQAMQHKLADCLMNIDGSRLTLEHAANRFDAGSGEWRVFGAAAVAFANQALRQTVLETHHAFGAIGFSEEHEMPRHFRRVHGDLARYGAERAAREQLARYLLDAEEDALPAYDLGPAANAFRDEVRAFLAKNWNEGHRAEERRIPLEDRNWNPGFTRTLFEKGWIGISWPKEYGGQGRTPLEQSVFVEEMAYADAPTTAHACAIELIAPAVMAFGTAEQKKRLLPAMERNEISCCLGYSETEAGSDLAALRTRAERDGDHWVINGQKLWSTLCDKVNHVWLAVRTDRDAKPKHAGISVFLVPLDTPGITIRPSMAMYGHTFCTIFLDDVRMPESAMIGGLNNGWKVITHALASERILMGSRVALLRSVVGELNASLKTAKAGGRALREDPVIRDRVGQIAAEIEVARQFTLRSVLMVEQGKTPVYEAAVGKVYTGELMERTLETAVAMLGAEATLSDESPAAPVHGRIEQLLRTSIMMVVGGGAAEIQRTIIAQRGVGLAGLK